MSSPVKLVNSSAPSGSRDWLKTWTNQTLSVFLILLSSPTPILHETPLMFVKSRRAEIQKSTKYYFQMSPNNSCSTIQLFCSQNIAWWVQQTRIFISLCCLIFGIRHNYIFFLAKQNLFSFHCSNFLLYHFYFLFALSPPLFLPLPVHLSLAVSLLMPVSVGWRITGSVWTIALWLISVIQPLSTGRLFIGDKWCWHNKSK